jgi:chromosome segregation ATPase
MNTQANTNNELLTLKTVSDLTKFLNAIDTADNAETTRFYETEKAINLLKVLRGQFSTLQHGNATCVANVGELPNAIYKPVIQSLYDTKKQAAELENREFTLQFESYRDFQVKALKFYIETGELFNRKKETLQEKAAVKIAKLEKELKAEQAKLAKAAKAKADADAAKAKADADAAKAKADAEQTIDEIHNIMDENPQGADAIKDDLIDIIESAEKTIVDADADAAKAKADAEQADAAKAKADADVNKTTEKLTKAKDKLANLSAGKADNKKSEPSLNFKTTNFSQDCKDTAEMLLIELEREASAPELLYLAKLILDKYNK